MYIHFTLLFKSVDNANQQFVFPFIEGKNQKTPPPKKKTKNNKLKKQNKNILTNLITYHNFNNFFQGRGIKRPKSINRDLN